ncbi:hypothetical protein Y032_0154g3026 [Ancylostoma ceylanicum]|uniref:SGNH domain-containing protein n=1 Tax=Ancylostoma ceylanicum TaxID=53326 RepID=A0A016SZF5_9BILA|nr:hypothetical protein Y032_0154g3026 [Ancylostoma ceylanicum]
MILQRDNRLYSVVFLTFYYRRKAILLISNSKKQDADLDYEKELLGAEDLFTHTWSLSVEMQWYFLVPLIFLSQRLITNWRKSFFTVIALLSIVFYSRVDDMTAFYSVYARIWQFCFGIIAYLAQENQAPSQVHLEERTMDGYEPAQSRKSGDVCYGLLVATVILLFLTFLVFCFSWSPFSKSLLRIIITILSAIMIFIGSRHQTILLANHIFAYVGDISYALYLVHWPIFVIVNSYSCLPFHARLAGLIISVDLAVAIHHLFELRYQRWSPLTIVLLVTAMFMISASMSYNISKNNENTWKSAISQLNHTNTNPSDAAWNKTLMRQLISSGLHTRGNTKLTSCERSTRISENLPSGRFCTANGTGIYKTLVIGNSFARNQADLVYNAFKNYISEFTVIYLVVTTFEACEVMTKTDYPWCEEEVNNSLLVFHKLKPDIVFVLIRSMRPSKAWLNTSEPIKEDLIFRDYMNRMIEMESVAEKIYLLQALPSCVDACTQKALDFTSSGRPLREIKEDLIIRDDFFARLRIFEVGRRCKKCEIIDYLPLLVDENGRYLGYEPKTNLMYLDDINHFTRFGKERIQILFNQLARKFGETRL